MSSVDEYLNQMYSETLITNQQTYDDRWKDTLRNKVYKSLGDFNYKSKEFSVTILETMDMGSYERIRVEITTFYPLRMPIFILIPKNSPKKKLPAVLAIHGHGYGSKEAIGLNPDSTEREEPGIHNQFAVQLVDKGLIVAVPELIGFGERKLEEDIGVGSAEANSCYRIASQLLLMGKTLAGLRVHECKRVIDYIQTLSQVDEKAIGCMGFSGGGLVAAFTSITDNRLKATVLTGYTNTFKGSIMDRQHCLDNYIPGILKAAELPELIGLIAPRSLFIESGFNDHLFPIKHVHTAIEKLEEIYQAFESEKSLASYIFEGGHEISGEQSFDWLIEQLSE